mgnify:CR=1 FL=1
MSDPDALAALATLDLRVGTVADARQAEGTRSPAIRLWVDFGPLIGVKQSSARITAHYAPDRLIGRQVVAAVNLPPKRVGGFVSEVLVLGLPDAADGIVLLRPDFPVPNGGRVH